MQNYRSFNEFLSKMNIDFDASRFYHNSDYIYYLPKNSIVDPSVHYIRTGLLMGRIRNDRFEPSQALAMELKADEWKDPLRLDAHDPRVLKYLKGETIDADDECEGYRLVCIKDHPLGWVKQNGNRCKNKYYPGWRYN